MCVSTHLTAILILAYNVLFKTHYMGLWMRESRVLFNKSNILLSDFHMLSFVLIIEVIRN